MANVHTNTQTKEIKMLFTPKTLTEKRLYFDTQKYWHISAR